jgi:hypothetical protein
LEQGLPALKAYDQNVLVQYPFEQVMHGDSVFLAAFFRGVSAHGVRRY